MGQHRSEEVQVAIATHNVPLSLQDLVRVRWGVILDLDIVNEFALRKGILGRKSFVEYS